MKKYQNKSRYLLFFSSLAVVLFIVSAAFYYFFPSEIYFNNLTRDVQIDQFDKTQMLELTKYPEQAYIHGLEIEISGNIISNQEVIIGTDPDKPYQHIKLKKGTVDFQYSSDWYDDNCYIILPKNATNKGDLTLSYRFQGTSKY